MGQLYLVPGKVGGWDERKALSGYWQLSQVDLAFELPREQAQQTWQFLTRRLPDAASEESS